jgi:carbamoyl-phosphate synthase small subunit
MTGYQEIMTDPSYAGQIVTFTFPHIGNTGTNDADD